MQSQRCKKHATGLLFIVTCSLTNWLSGDVLLTDVGCKEKKLQGSIGFARLNRLKRPLCNGGDKPTNSTCSIGAPAGAPDGFDAATE